MCQVTLPSPGVFAIDITPHPGSHALAPNFPKEIDNAQRTRVAGAGVVHA